MFPYCLLDNNSSVVSQNLCELEGGEKKKSMVGSIFLEQSVCTVSGFAVILITHASTITFLLVPDVSNAIWGGRREKYNENLLDFHIIHNFCIPAKEGYGSACDV